MVSALLVRRYGFSSGVVAVAAHAASRRVALAPRRVATLRDDHAAARLRDPRARERPDAEVLDRALARRVVAATPAWGSVPRCALPDAVTMLRVSATVRSYT